MRHIVGIILIIFIRLGEAWAAQGYAEKGLTVGSFLLLSHLLPLSMCFAVSADDVNTPTMADLQASHKTFWKETHALALTRQCKPAPAHWHYHHPWFAD